MASRQHIHDESAPVVAMPTYSRNLGQNELSYYLPSRVYGLNDMFTRVIFRAPPALASPFRLRVVWAIMRVQHSLLACQIDMDPGCYDDAQFVYTPPSSPKDAMEHAGRTLTIHDDKRGHELDEDFISGRRKLSAHCLGRMDVARHGEVSSSVDEFHMSFTVLHAITDGTSAHGNTILQFLGGSSTPGGPARTDAELLQILEMEWSKRWGKPRIEYEVITPAAEARLPRPRSRFELAVWRVDSQNVQGRAIGAHAFPRIASEVTKQTLVDVRFDRAQTAALAAKCKSERVTLQNTVFVLCNFAWIRTAAAHPELLSAPKTLPMLFYTAISLRRHLAPISPLASAMSLALGYGNIVLPAFIPSAPGVDVRKVFWLRARGVQAQMHKQTRSPMLLPRAQILSFERGRRAKAFAKQDDEADGTLPRSNQARTRQNQDDKKPPVQLQAPTIPSVALMGISHLGDLTSTYRTERYPSIEFVDSVGHSRKAKGGILLFTRSAQGCFSTMLEWDAAAFPPGLVEEFWGHFVGGVHEFILDGAPSAQVKL
ncbi:hypothetical protein C8F04DRAFT_133927 [Mycena alexandri]|uniref:Uncharacterized protein n=1 Tax=Mycena alexandri TaxID=1745969 RepID=A0AAD6SCW5_9AGAR|nr:hypothetical protein C8F04DRAFT_133927 [Mycena alexandri]